MQMGLIRTVTLVFPLFVSAAVHAACEVPAKFTDDQLRNGKLIHTERDGDRYRVWAKALTKAPFDRFYAAMIDFDRYKAMGMKAIEKMITLDRPGGSTGTFHVWNHQEQAGLMSFKNFLTFNASKNGAEGVLEYGLADRKLVKGRGWNLEYDDKFAALYGKVYICDTGKGDVYVDYYLDVILDVWLPNWIIGGFVEGGLEKSLTTMLRSLTKAANKK